MRYKVLDVKTKKEKILHECITNFEIGDCKRIQVVKNGKWEIHVYKILEKLPDIV